MEELPGNALIAYYIFCALLFVFAASIISPHRKAAGLAR